MPLTGMPGDYFDEKEVWPEERWRRFQWRRLRAVLRFAYMELPFYRKRFHQAGLTPEDIRRPDDLLGLPLLRKADVLKAMKEAGTFALGMESPEPEGPKALGMTSGTLGTAFLSFPAAWRRILGDSLCRAYWWAGLRPGARMMTAAPAWHSMAVQESRMAQQLGVKCVFPWGTFLPRFAEGFLDALLDLRPSFLSIFLPMLYALLAECRRRDMNARVAFSSVESVLAVGAPMTPGARLGLKEELGVKDIFEGAGNPEGLIAMECSQHQGHHYFVDVCYVEILDPLTGRPLPPGQRGSVVITSLVPHGSVHIRYDTEDVGEILPGSCPCGRTWPRIEVYDRRANAFQVRERQLFWYDVRLCLDQVPELIGVPFAVVRSPISAPALRIAIQRPAGHDPDHLERLVRELVATSLQVPLQAEWVDELPVRWKGVTVIDEQDWTATRA